MRPIDSRENSLGIVFAVAAVGANHKVVQQRRGEKIVPTNAEEMRREILLPGIWIDGVRKDGVPARRAAVLAGIVRPEQLALLGKVVIDSDCRTCVRDRYGAREREIIELGCFVGWLRPESQ